jgi:hypothetical protein
MVSVPHLEHVEHDPESAEHEQAELRRDVYPRREVQGREEDGDPEGGVFGLRMLHQELQHRKSTHGREHVRR